MQKCKHEGCRCQTDGSRNDGYCSEQCRDQPAVAGKCGCGHSDCA